MKPSRDIVYNRCGGCCGYCGQQITIKQMQVDHIIPQRNFEQHIKNNSRIPGFLSHLKISDINHIDNIMPACRSCNNFKSTFDLELFRRELQDQADRIPKYSSTVRLAQRFGILTITPKPIVFYFETL